MAIRNQETYFIVDCIDAGPGDIELSILDERGCDVLFINNDCDDGKIKISFTPQTAGPKYTINAYFAGLEIAQSPITINIKSDIDFSNVKLEELRTHVYKESFEYFYINVKNVENNNLIKVLPKIINPHNNLIPVIISLKEDGIYKCKYSPLEEGTYKIEIYCNDILIFPKPFQVHVTTGFDPSRVTLSGEGLKNGALARCRDFLINLEGAGQGGLSVTIDGPTKTDISCIDNEDGTCLVQYFPTEEGNYKIHVRFHDKIIPGSPFNVTIKDQIPGRHVKCYGLGLEKPSRVNRWSIFNINTAEESDNLPIKVEINGLQSKEIIETIITKEEKLYEVKYICKYAENIEIKVTVDGYNIKNSPFYVTVLPIYEIDKIIVSGDGIKPVLGFIQVSNNKTSFSINIAKAGELKIDVGINDSNKCKVPVEIELKENTYFCSYLVSVAGDYEISILCNGIHIEDSPFIINSIEDVIYNEVIEGNHTIIHHINENDQIINNCNHEEKNKFIVINSEKTLKSSPDIDYLEDRSTDIIPINDYISKTGESELSENTLFHVVDASQKIQNNEPIFLENNILIEESITAKENNENLYTIVSQKIERKSLEIIPTQVDRPHRDIFSEISSMDNTFIIDDQLSVKDNQTNDNNIEYITSEEYDIKPLEIISTDISMFGHNNEKYVTLIETPHNIQVNSDSLILNNIETKSKEIIKPAPNNINIKIIETLKNIELCTDPIISSNIETNYTEIIPIISDLSQMKNSEINSLMINKNNDSYIDSFIKIETSERRSSEAIPQIKLASNEHEVDVTFTNSTYSENNDIQKLTWTHDNDKEIEIMSKKEENYNILLSDNIKYTKEAESNSKHLNNNDILDTSNQDELDITFTNSIYSENQKLILTNESNNYIDQESEIKSKTKESNNMSLSNDLKDAKEAENNNKHLNNYKVDRKVTVDDIKKDMMSDTKENPEEKQRESNSHESSETAFLQTSSLILNKFHEENNISEQIKESSHNVVQYPQFEKSNATKENMKGSSDYNILTMIHMKYLIPSSCKDVKAAINCQDTTAIEADIEINHDYPYVHIYFQPVCVGDYVLHIVCDNVPLLRSPYLIKVNTEFVFSQIFATGLGLSSSTIYEWSQFTIVSQNTTSNDFSVTIYGPNICQIFSQDNEDGTHTIYYMTFTSGIYSIVIKYLDSEIIGSPFSINVSRLQFKHSCLKLETMTEIPIKPLDAYVESLYIVVQTPFNVKDIWTCTLTPNGYLGILVRPKIEGKYFLYSVLGNKKLNPKPYCLNIDLHHLPHPEYTEVINTINDVYYAGEYISFIINTSKSGYGDLNIIIEGPEYGEIETESLEQGQCEIRFIAKFCGIYVVSIFFASQMINTYPKIIKVIDEEILFSTSTFNSSLNSVNCIKVNDIVQLEWPHQKVGPIMNVRAKIKAPSGSVEYCDIIDFDNHHFNIQFTPHEVGEHRVSVKSGKIHVPGSPFKFFVENIEESNSENVQVFGMGLQCGYTNEINEFSIYSRDAGQGNLSISIDGPSKAIIKMEESSEGTNIVRYEIPLRGQYICSIKLNDVHIPGSPFQLSIEEQIITSNSNNVTLASVQNHSAVVGNTSSFLIKHGALRNGLMKAFVVTPSMHEESVKINYLEDDHFNVQFEPNQTGIHYIHILLDDKPIVGSPFEVLVGEVTAHGNGLNGGKVGEENCFTLDTKSIEPGPLTVTIDGPSKVELDCYESEQGYEFSYVPTLPGEYVIAVKYGNNIHAKGSPFRANVTGESQKSIQSQRSQALGSLPRELKSYTENVKCRGDGLVKAFYGRNNQFVVDASSGGAGILYVGIIGPSKPCEEITIRHIGGKRFQVNYFIQEFGEHIITLKWGDKEIPGSPYIAYVQ